MATVVSLKKENNLEEDQKPKATLSAHSARFFNPKEESPNPAAEYNKKPAVPFGLKFAKEVTISPHQNPTQRATATNVPTPRGDSKPDIGMDIDY